MMYICDGKRVLIIRNTALLFMHIEELEYLNSSMQEIVLQEMFCL